MITQNYGALRVVRVRQARSPDGSMNAAVKYPTGWLPEEGLVHVLTQHETSIGRALNNDVVLMDPTVSREHARLVLDRDGWHIINLTSRNIVRVNGRSVPSGSSLPIHPQDVLILGSTMLQLIAPQNPQTSTSDENDLLDDITQLLFPRHLCRGIRSHLPSYRYQTLILGMREQSRGSKMDSPNHLGNFRFLLNLIPSMKLNSGKMMKACSERV